MSHNMLQHPSGLYVTRFAGPARDDGGPRTMYQITTENGTFAQLTTEQWAVLLRVAASIAKLDSVRITSEHSALLWPDARAGIYDTVQSLIDAHENMLEGLLHNAPQSWDQDEAAEGIAVSYLHHLEQEVQRLGGNLDRPTA